MIRRLLLLSMLSISAPALAQAPAKTPAPAPKPGAPAKAEPEGLDVSKLPFDRMAIQQVVQHHMPAIQSCYEEVLADTGQALNGRVMVGFIVDPEGFVSEARALPKKSTMKDARVIDCVVSNVRRWRFPKPGDNRDHPIEYPFDLKVVK